MGCLMVWILQAAPAVPGAVQGLPVPVNLDPVTGVLVGVVTWFMHRIWVQQELQRATLERNTRVTLLLQMNLAANAEERRAHLEAELASMPPANSTQKSS